MPEPHKFQEGDEVVVKQGARAGKLAVIIEIRPNGSLRVRFADDRVLPYSPNEVEPVSLSAKFRVGDEALVISGTHKGKRGKVTRLCPLAPEFRSHIDLPGLVLETDGCIRNSELELMLRDNTKSDKPVRLVGITGRKRTGKDTVAARLVEKHGFKRMAFADNVRKVALAIDPLIETEVGLRRLSNAVGWLGWEKSKDIPEVRRVLQKIGTEGIRALEPDFWIRQVMRQAVFSSAPVVITDVRFPNEADAIKKAGGVILRVNRPGLSEEDSHSSETAMDGYLHDWSVSNTGTVEDLHRKVDGWVANVFNKARS